MNRREFVALAAAAPFFLGDLSARAASAPHALVTCDAESRLALVDLGALRIVGKVATPPDPRAIEQVGPYAVVCHTAAGVVTVVDRHRVRHTLHEFVEPRYVAAHPDGVHAFVTDSGSSGVVSIDTRSGRALGRARLSGWARHVTIDASGRRLAADGAPQHVTFSSNRAYVTSGVDGAFRVHGLTGEVLRTTAIPIGSYNVQHGLGFVLTPSLIRGTLAVLDDEGRLLRVLRVASSCHDACFIA